MIKDIEKSLFYAEYLMSQFILGKSAIVHRRDAEKMALMIFHLREVITTLGDDAEWVNATTKGKT